MLKDLDFGVAHKEKLRREALELTEVLREHSELASLELKEFKQKSIAAILERLNFRNPRLKKYCNSFISNGSPGRRIGRRSVA